MLQISFGFPGQCAVLLISRITPAPVLPIAQLRLLKQQHGQSRATYAVCLSDIFIHVTLLCASTQTSARAPDA